MWFPCILLSDHVLQCSLAMRYRSNVFRVIEQSAPRARVLDRRVTAVGGFAEGLAIL